MTELEIRDLILNVIREELTVELSNYGDTGEIRLNVHLGNTFICETSINIRSDIEQIASCN